MMLHKIGQQDVRGKISYFVSLDFINNHAQSKFKFIIVYIYIVTANIYII